MMRVDLGRLSVMAGLVASLGMTAPALRAQTPVSTTLLPPTTETAPAAPTDSATAAPASTAAALAPENSAAAAAPSYAGRLSVVIQTEPSPQQMVADFELEGDAQRGELRLFGPFGISIAVLQWEPGRALLIEGERRRAVRSIDWLVERVTGAPLPVAMIFDWLQGRPVRTDDWAVAPRDKPDAPLRATRLQPLPRIEMALTLKKASP